MTAAKNGDLIYACLKSLVLEKDFVDHSSRQQQSGVV